VYIFRAKFFLVVVQLLNGCVLSRFTLSCNFFEAYPLCINTPFSSFWSFCLFVFIHYYFDLW